MLMRIEAYLLQLQQQICTELTSLDNVKQFNTTSWAREAGGGGITKIMTDGAVFNKAGVNFSHIYGDKLPPTACANRM